MRQATYLPPFTRMDETDEVSKNKNHHWFIDCMGLEYLEIVAWLRDMAWQGDVRWYPEYFPGHQLTDTKLVIHIEASDDRDAILIKLSL